MTPVEFVGILLGAFGFAYIAGHATISLPLRTWLGGIPGEPGADGTPGRLPIPGALGRFGEFLCALLECPACLGFWLGCSLGITILKSASGMWPHPILWSIWMGCITSGFNFLLGRATRLI